MLSGDFSTMPLADVLQWVDATRVRALVTVHRADGSQWFLTEERMIVAASPPQMRGKLAADGTPQEPGPGLKAATRDHLLDVFLLTEGRFDLVNAEPPEPGVAMQIPLQFMVMEGLRLLDEWPRLLETYPSEEARLVATDVDPEGLDPVQAVIREEALLAPALAEARLVLGLSRTGLLRRVDEMRARGVIDVEGTPHGPDIEGSLIDQAQILLRERQYAEAAHVFKSLLASNPADARVRHLLADTERLQIEAAYERFSPTDIVGSAGDPANHKLKGTELAVLDQLARPRSVAVLVLVSPLRELETLLSLGRLEKKGLVAIESAE